MFEGALVVGVIIIIGMLVVGEAACTALVEQRFAE